VSHRILCFIGVTIICVQTEHSAISMSRAFA